jgi:mannose-6-phosphate isomerase-like protein (cupin superfamily)
MAFKHLKLSDIADQAPGYGVDSLEARPARTELGAERIGLTAYRVKPGRRVGFGHSHDTVEEVYLVTSGSGRFKVDEEIVDVGPGEVVYCPPQVVREWEAGRDGLEVVAFGAHAEGDGNLQPGWWTD